MGISRNPYMTGSRKTAANMTWREVLGQQLFQTIRARGQSNPSPQYLFNQAIPAMLWPIFRLNAQNIRSGWLSKLTKQPASSAWYGSMVKAAVINVGGVPSIDGTLFGITKGTMTQTAFTAVAHAATQTVVLTWSATPADITQAATDFTAVLATLTSPSVEFNNNDPMRAEYGDASRADGTTTVTLPPGSFIVGDTVSVYLGFVGERLSSTAGTSSSSIQVTAIAVT